MKIISVIERLLIYFNVKTQRELAEQLGVSVTTLSNWKSRNTIDYELLFTKCENINFDWLFMGRGEMFPGIYNKIDAVADGPPLEYSSYKDLLRAKDVIITTQERYINHLESELEKHHEEPDKTGQKRKAG